MKKSMTMLLVACCLLAAFSMSASALEYRFDGPDAGVFGTPTSEGIIIIGVGEAVNRNRSKDAAYIPPAFASPTGYTLGSWERLTPNLVSGSTDSIGGGSGVTVLPPSQAGSDAGISSDALPIGYTAVTDDLYYNAGHIGTLKIPAIGLTVKVYEGTDSAALRKGAGHFANTSIWDGNVAIAGHNRGVNNHFGKLHTLGMGDTIKLTTKLGTRSYEVCSIAKISVNDVSVLNDSAENIITLVTCVKDQPEYRWCVQAKMV